jgi:heme-degrading monooxygenase HmoA
MYASVRRYRVEPKNMDELVKRIPGAVDVISRLNGFRAYYVVRGGDDTIATLSVFSDKAAAVQSNQAAAKWVKENVADLLSGNVDAVTGDVIAYK